VKTQRVLSSNAAAIATATLGAVAAGAEEGGAMLSPQALQEIAQLEAEIDRIEAQMVERLAAAPDNQVQQVELLVRWQQWQHAQSVDTAHSARRHKGLRGTGG
jgi:cytochrome c peroxidase